MISVATPIPLDELPAHMRALAEDMRSVGAAIRYYGGFGPFAEYGDMLETQSAPICHQLAEQIESFRGGRA
jgi:hypothetical protein